MATLVSKATGNFTDSGTWAPVATETGCELDYAEGNNATSLSAGSTGRSAAFTPGANEVDGIGLRLYSYASLTSTITVKLENQTAPGSREGSVTINPADLPTFTGSASPAGSWLFFKFTPVTPNGTDSYKVAVTLTGGVGSLSLYVNNVASNWVRFLRRTSAASAPAAGDKLIVCGEYTGQGTSNSFTVTMDNTATTSFGPTVDANIPAGVAVGGKGTLSYGTAASTAYYLKVKGVLAVGAGGTLNIGTSGTPVPSTSSAVLEFDAVTDVDSGLVVGAAGTVNAYGATVTTTATVLTADKVAGNTVLAVGDTTGWVANDEIGIAATTRTASECERRTILTVDSSTQVTVTAGLTNAHSGTSPTQAEVMHFTRNVKIRGLDSTHHGYVRAADYSTVAMRYVEFQWLGSNTTGKLGIAWEGLTSTSGGSFDMRYCSYRDGANSGTAFISLTNTDRYTLIGNVFFGGTQGTGINNGGTSGTSWTITNNLVMGYQMCYSPYDTGGVFSDNTAVGGTYGMYVNDSVGQIGTWGNLVAHACTYGFYFNQMPVVGTAGALTAWRCSSAGIQMNGCWLTVTGTVTLFGSPSNVNLNGGAYLALLGGSALNGDTTFSSASGLNISGPGIAVVENGDFGTASGIKTTHSTADIVTTGLVPIQATLRNCKLSSTTEVSLPSNAPTGCFVRSQKHDQTVGLHRAWYPSGRIESDTSEYRTASPSEKLTPTSATIKLESGVKQVAVPSGSTTTVTVHVKKSGSYAGNAPRLISKKNVAAGLSSDTVLATLTGGADADGYWTLSGTSPSTTDDAVLEFVVDCDGTAGTVNVDDWSAS